VSTDFEEFGLAGGRLTPPGRHLLVTVDFEAFSAEVAAAWSDAMRHWATAADGLPVTFFAALEHLRRLATADRAAYREFLDAAAAMAAAGASFQPHNHSLFDPETGANPERRFPAPDGYRKRVSGFCDVVYRHNEDFGVWMRQLRELHAALLAEAGIAPPPRLAYRAGGWDHGSSADDLRTYLTALADAGFAIDSSATAGTFGTADWRVGSPFGKGTFELSRGVVEIAPTVSVDCSQPARCQLRALLGASGALTSRRGALVTVLHFDHLFRDANGDRSIVRARIDATTRALRRAATLLRLRPTALEQLPLRASSPAHL
jgi:hypothetical protein